MLILSLVDMNYNSASILFYPIFPVCKWWCFSYCIYVHCKCLLYFVKFVMFCGYIIHHVANYANILLFLCFFVVSLFENV